MKKFLLTIITSLIAAVPSIAQEIVKTLYDGDPKSVTWENTLIIPAEQFNENVKVGDYIYITFSQTSDVIEIKANGTWLPGSRYTNLGEDTPDFKAYITKDMLDALKEYGLEICGASFTVTGVSICNDGFVMPEGAIWGGYFWVDNWNTLEIFKTAFSSYEGERYMDIYLSEDNGDYTGYFMKVLTKWEPETVWANNDQITHTPKIATVDLQNIDVPASLADVNAVMIQGNKETGNPFNITAVVLRNGASGVVTTIESDNCNITDIYNLQGVKIRSKLPQESATEDLPSGVYIVGDKKVLVR